MLPSLLISVLFQIILFRSLHRMDWTDTNQSSSLEEFEKALRHTAARCNRMYYSLKLFLIFLRIALVVFVASLFKDTNCIPTIHKLVATLLLFSFITLLGKIQESKGIEPGKDALARMNRIVLQPSCGLSFDVRTGKLNSLD